MNDPLGLVLSAIAGIALGALFFGGLWWTIRRAVASPRPAVWFLGSLMVRMGITVVGFFSVGKDDWSRMIACLVGFIVARYLVIRLTPAPDGMGKEADHAS